MQNTSAGHEQFNTYSSFYPLLLVAATLLLMTVFQASQLFRERTELTRIAFNQEKPMQESRKVRAQFDAIATQTAKLAAQGNRNAGLVVAQLKKRGISIDPPSQMPH